MNQFQGYFLAWFTIASSIFQGSVSYSVYDTKDISYRLPKTLYPEYYRVEILTNLADYNNNYTFEGRVWIQIRCKKPTNKIILHSKNLEIDEQNVVVKVLSEMLPGEEGEDEVIRDCCPLKITDHCYHDDYEFYVITLGEELSPKKTYSVYIPYKGELTQGLAGYYRSSYRDLKTGETRWLAVTQFESTDARRALPCFDEPDFKARFQVNLGHINFRTSISNMRIVATEPIEGMKDWVWDKYEVTVPMSTYLLAFVVSDFNHKVSPQQTSNEVTFRVWARNDALNQVDYATVVGPKVLEYFENYFDVKYPLPKCDMVAIPDFSSGAMENWGLITYRETALLYDPDVSTASSQPYVASVIAHEIAHQWFGNLVTMKWWSDLWLNEGFATYVAALGVHYLHPEWKSLEEEVVDNAIIVFSHDALVSSHPISVPIGHPKEIPEIFDAISYKKGAFVLRMMNFFLGEETFRKGVTNYLKINAFKNAEQDDLWECLTEEAHKTQALPTTVTVKQIMDSWTLQTGYPVLTVVRDYSTGTAMICQEKYLEDRTGVDSGVETGKINWWVPLSYTIESEKNFSDTSPKKWLSLEQPSTVIEGVPNSEWIIFNIMISGLYRVKYDAENWNKLITALCTNHYDIGMLNRVQLIEDSMQLAKSGDIEYTIPFNILKYLDKEKQYLPWKAALKNLAYIDKMLRFYPAYGYYRVFIKNLLKDIYEKLSQKTYSNTPLNLSKIKHQTLISIYSCKFEVGDCKDKAIRLFQDWMNEENPDEVNPVPKDLRGTIYCTSVRYGGEKEWNFLWNRYLMSNVGNERSILLLSLCCSREIWILNRYLEWSIDENSGIRKQDSLNVFAGIAREDFGYLLAKNFLKARLPDIYEYFGPKSSKIGSYLSSVASQVTSPNELKELSQFFRDNEKYFQHSQRAVQQGLETAKINIQWQNKFYAGLSAYLQSQAMQEE